jgi:hypothetical protein
MKLLLCVAGKQFSFLSQYEVDRMRQEEEEKMGLGSADYLRSNELEQVVEEEEEYCEDELNQKLDTILEGNVLDSHGMERESEREVDPNYRASGHTRSVSASSMSSVSSTGSVRTAKAERRLKERLGKEVCGLKLVKPTGSHQPQSSFHAVLTDDNNVFY